MRSSDRVLMGLERVALRLLVTHGELTGSELVTRSNGRISRDAVWDVLGRLQAKGLAGHDVLYPDIGPLKPLKPFYFATPKGASVLKAWQLENPNQQ